MPNCKTWVKNFAWESQIIELLILDRIFPMLCPICEDDFSCERAVYTSN